MFGISFAVPLNRKERAVKVNPVMEVLCGIVMYGMVFFFILADITTMFYQFVYFNTYDIPWIKRSDYVKLQRHRLSKLSIYQKIACVYCDYCNGVIAWCKAVVNQTEIYSCAIKYPNDGLGKEHRADFKPYEDFA